MSLKTRNGGGETLSRNVLTRNSTLLLCFGSFCAGMLFTSRMWVVPEAKGITRRMGIQDEKLKLLSDGCDPRQKLLTHESKDTLSEVSKTHQAIETLDKTISNLEMELFAARATQESILNVSPGTENLQSTDSVAKGKYLMVVGINTAFNSRKRRDSIRATWMPQGGKRNKLEEDKGIIIRFVIGHSTTSGGILDKAIEAEEKMHGDFLRLDHVEGYLELSAKTKAYFSTAVTLWDADFYVKVDDDVHVNIGTLGTTLMRHRSKPRVYIGCMKSGPVLAQKGVRYHEPEYWKFGEAGNKYFRHATGQLYAISKDLATYIYINQHVLHKYVNEDVSLGSWVLGLDVEHIDDRRLCCGTPLIASGRLRQATSVLLLSIGAVAGFASPMREFMKSIDGVEKVTVLCGLQFSDRSVPLNSRRPKNKK
ncbi:hypothetical protein AQUCO_11900001v1 [Aquilegia coerulea]|uniref:Hexosyltransferase n=1 Tax=Aquilegia coerulea TaxID=218851 RepID=A0A2G5C219_AQUCA|nr:hypothetical protein AQUCO_11900001v1 [Aquilegia coerulea]